MRSEKHTIAIIVTWFGKLPEYFPAWLRSAENNTDIDFYLIFDQDVYSESQNIHFIKTTLQREVERIGKALNEKITINKPYKFCDLRIFFGEAYKDILKNYEFWGYCDIDLVFGNIRKFLSDDILENYDRFYDWGHLSIFRNNYKMNHLYDLKGGIYSKDEIFRGKEKTTPEEHFGINRICEINNIKWYRNVDYADFFVMYSSLILCHKCINYYHQVFYCEYGNVFRAYYENGKIKTNDYVYIHWQKRKPKINEKLGECFFVTSNELINKKPGVPTLLDIDNYNPPLDVKEKKSQRRKYIKKKLLEFIHSSARGKAIWMRQKKYAIKETGEIVGH